MGPALYIIYMKITYWLQFTAVLVVAVILFFGIYKGVTKGALNAKSEVILANTKTLTQGLSYFYQDQNRYPSQEEFADKNLMLAYVSGYPAVSISGGSCTPDFGDQSNYDYHSLDFQSYELNFCLPSSVENFPAGKNTAKR